MADEDLKAELERLKAENEALKKRRSSAVSMKVSERGAVSVYGLGRFPVNLPGAMELCKSASYRAEYLRTTSSGTAPDIFVVLTVNVHLPIAV